jgi:hypothetical protein
MENKKTKRKMKLNARRIIVLIALILIILLVIFGLVKLFKVIFSKEKIVGNEANMGLAIADGNTVYYNKYENGIVKVKNGEEYQITDETAYCINIVDDTIYYLTVSSSNTIDLKSVKTNGDSLTKIKTLSTSISKFYIEDGYAYYATDSTGISKLSLETSEENIITTANIRDFVLDNGIIYFTDSVGYLYSITTSGSDKVEISKDYNIKYIQVLKNWIYFYDETENALCKIKKNGSKKTTVATFVNNEMYNITSKNIYYYDAVNKQICKSDLKGKKSTPVVTLGTTRTKINIANGVIYYLDNSKDTSQIYQMFRVKENGNSTNSIDY